MQHISPEKIKELERKANDIRKTIIEMLIEAKSGHTAGPLDMADIFTALYFHLLKHDPKKPDWSERDRLVLSNGHICPVLYATMAHAEYFEVKETLTLRKFKSRLQGHPHREWLPGLETSSGPLGSGLSQAIGMALADRMNNGKVSSCFFYCLTGDGELDAGQNWEAAMLAGKEKLGNLIVIVDRNNIQIDGNTEDIMPLEPLKQKWRSFNFHVVEINGHDFEQIIASVEYAKTIGNKPILIIAHTIASKGIPEFERMFEWHGKPPTTMEEIGIARHALDAIAEKLK
ncbi:MAG: transketolase [Candidatus Taylorbacteria bacterium]|nr:transketolase [Candidatus Taylorbacteria bacterium]